MHIQDPAQYPTRFIASTQLRDLLLHSEFDVKRRDRIWRSVQKLVETNANVRARTADVYGEPNRVWEWFGVTKSPKIV